jgi:HPt (histidine-containing phosphotransfer) domain-containing protein
MTRPVLNQFSIRQRLLLLTMLTSGIGVLLGCAGDAERFLAAGMDGYVSKPIQTAILRAEIDRLTQSKITNEGECMTNDRNPPGESRVNFAELLTRVENDHELLWDLFSIFKEEFPSHLASLENAVAQNNIAEIANVSHTLKGMLSNLAVAKAAASAARVEQLARAGESASLQHAYAEFAREVHGLLPEMESYLVEARS